MDGVGCDEETVSRVLGGLDKYEAQAVGARYFQKYNKSLVERLKSETGSNYCSALTTWLESGDPAGGPHANTPQLQVNAIKLAVASFDADLLHRAKKGIGTDERLVVDVLCLRTKSQMDAIDVVYRQRYGKTLKQFIEKEMGGNLERFLSYMQMEEAEFDSYVLKKAFDGFGTGER